ncbi:hypothetical protein ACFVVA_37135 [Kitasatospora sp. NPDC058048]|uniref:hypothetical protein n=1 Tax=Kitasatospora sp. NPDC058048 TaxID=3346313 RepID=UPI0036DDD074
MDQEGDSRAMGSGDVLTPEMLRGCAEPAKAERMAAALISGPEFYQACGRTLLARFLLAAGRSGADVATMVRWIENPSDPTPLLVLCEHAEDLPEGWVQMPVMPEDVQASARYMALLAVS